MGQSKGSKPAFTCQEIERHLKSALMAATPDVWSRLDLSVPQEQEAEAVSGKIRHLETGRRERGVLEAGLKGAGQSVTGRLQSQESGRHGKSGEHGQVSGQSRWERLRARAAGFGRTSRRWGAAAAACICLLAVGSGYYHYSYLQVASSVEIDVNPSLRIFLNRREKVLQVQALNEDGERLMDGSRLKGQSVGAAMDQVLDALVEKGYLGQDGKEHAILVSVSGRDAGKAEQLKTEVSADVESALIEKEVRAVVYDQTIQETDTLKELAQTYQVSVGKAGFVEQLILENEELDPGSQEVYSQLMGQTMEELTQEIGQKDYQVGQKVTVVRTGPQEALPAMADASDGEHSPERGQDRSEAGQILEGEGVQGSALEEKETDADTALTSGKPEDGQAAGQDTDVSAEKEAGESGIADSGQAAGVLPAQEEQGLPEETGDPGAFQESMADQPEETEAPLESQEQIEGETAALPAEQGETESPADGAGEDGKEPAAGPIAADPVSEGQEQEDPSQDLGQPAGTAPADRDGDTVPFRGEAGQATAGGESRDEADQATAGGESRDEAGQATAGGESRDEAGQATAGGESRDEAGHVTAGGESRDEAGQMATGGEHQGDVGQVTTGGEHRDEAGQAMTGGETRDETGQVTAAGEPRPEESDTRSAAEEGELHDAGAARPPVETETRPEREETSLHDPGTDMEPPTVHRHETRKEMDREEEMEDEMEEEDTDTITQIIRNTSDEWSILAPGDIKTPQEMSQMTTSRRGQSTLTDGGKEAWREPVYASEFMSSAERRLLQKGPGAFSGDVSEEEKKEILWFGPGFAFLNESTREFFAQIFEGKN